MEKITLEAIKALEMTVEEIAEIAQNEPEEDVLSLGKYGGLFLDYLKANHPSRYAFLILEMTLEETARQVEAEAVSMVTALKRQLRSQTPRPQGDYLEIAQYETMIQAQAEEVVLHEIVYKVR